MVRAHAVVLALALAGCMDAEPATGQDPPTDPTLATDVLAAPGASDGAFGDPARAVNGVRGFGDSSGSTDVFSLAREGEAASITLGWAEPVYDGPGVDVVVYENPFVHPGGVFIDPVVVELSADGETWVAYPHDYVAEDELAWSADPDHWQGFAGLTPVALHVEDNPTDPLDPAVSGGDGFDLALLGASPEAELVRELGACCVRLWSASAWTNPDTGEAFPRDPVGNGADIDGVHGATPR